jgi:C1A family cysteine protease
MKNLIIKFLPVFLALLLISCSTTVPTKPYKEASFLTKKEILSGINETCDPKEEERSASDMDAKFKKRWDSLIPHPIFLEGIKDLKPVVKERAAKTVIPDEVDLTEFVTSIKDQNNGYCTAFATAGGVEASLCRQKSLCSEDLSEQYLFSLYKKYSTEKAVIAATENWLVDEKYWPKYGDPVSNIEEFTHAKIVKYNYLGEDHDALMEAISKGHFVVIAMKTPKDMLYCRETIRTSTSFSTGGHAVLAVGYQKTDEVSGGMYVKIKNSWGADCGDSGFQYVPFAGICDKSTAYCHYWEIEEVVSTKTTLCK